VNVEKCWYENHKWLPKDKHLPHSRHNCKL
jgi:hypothetical protein